MNGFSSLVVLASVVLTVRPPKKVIYGKYFSIKSGEGAQGKHDYSDNTYYLYTPPRNLHNEKKKQTHSNTSHHNKNFRPLAPTVVHFYGCGWKNCGEPWVKAGPIVGDLVRNGMAVASVGYRRITTTYWYDDQRAKNKRSPEELIHVDSEGRLSLDTKGRTFADYKVRICRHEFIVKPFYDAQLAMEHLLATKFVHGLDLNRLVFWAYSAGGSMAQYLTHVYHRWNIGSYTPLGMFYRSSMLDLPTANILDRVWHLIARATKHASRTKLKDLIDKKDCWWVVGNSCNNSKFDKFIEQDMPYQICNETWNRVALDKYCGTNFETATVGELERTQRWPDDDPEVGEGMQKIWYATWNMQQHTPKPYYVLLHNIKTEDYGLLHSSLYIPSYKRSFNEAGVFYTAYYDDHPQMDDYDDPKGGDIRTVVMGDGNPVQYQSNHGWLDMLEDAGFPPHLHGGTREHIQYVCFVLGQPSCSPQFAKARDSLPGRLLYV